MAHSWQMKDITDESKLADDINPIKQKVQSVNFEKQTHRRDISDGFPSVNESRFKKTHSSMIRENNGNKIEIEKFSTRDNYSTAGKPFEVPLTGLMYNIEPSFTNTQQSV